MPRYFYRAMVAPQLLAALPLTTWMGKTHIHQPLLQAQQLRDKQTDADIAFVFSMTLQ